MAHGHATLTESDTKRLGSKAFDLFVWPLAVGLLGLALAGVLAVLSKDNRGLERFAHSYLWAYAFVCSFSFGCMALMLISTLFRGAWQVLIRRVWETYAMMWLPWLAVGAIPLVVFAARHDGLLYTWNLPTTDGQLQHTHQIFAIEDQAEIDAMIEAGVIKSADDPFPANFFIDLPAEFDDGGVYAALKPLQHATSPYSTGTIADPAPGHGDSHGTSGDGAGHDAGHEPGHEGEQGDAHAGHDHADAAVTPRVIPVADTGHDEAGHDDAHAGAHNNPLIEGKKPWLNTPFWAGRVFAYMLTLGGVCLFFYKTSVAADETDGPMSDESARLTRRNEKFAPLGIILFGCLITFFSFDLLMALDPTWYSTMFGIRFFAGSMIAGLSLTILTLRVLQHQGFLASVNIEHYHDLGKLLFAFVFFWTYVSFSQYMLIWYAELPAEIPWFAVRGALTVEGSATAYTPISILLVFGHFIIPFCFLLSRHIKRNLTTLSLAAAWMIVFHAIDLFWIVMPEFDNREIFWNFASVLIDLGCIVGLSCVYLALAARLAAKASLVPVGDPRLPDSLNHQNLY